MAQRILRHLEEWSPAIIGSGLFLMVLSVIVHQMLSGNLFWAYGSRDAEFVWTLRGTMSGFGLFAVGLTTWVMKFD